MGSRRALGAAVALLWGLGVGSRASAQESFSPAVRPTAEWPRWGSPQAPGADTATQVRPAGSDEAVYLGATLGAALGMAATLWISLDACQSIDCGSDEYAALTTIFVIGAAGGGVGSVVGGCLSARETGCVRRALPSALVGGFAGLAGGTAVGVMTESWLASWIAYSAIHGLITAGAIR